MSLEGQTQWRLGDLVLHEADPKTHAMLMEVLEIKCHQAKTVYLARPRASNGEGATTPPGTWHRLAELRDPRVYLRTEEFAQTLRQRNHRS